MKRELVSQIIKEAPLLFSDDNGKPLCADTFYIETDDGWFNLVKDLSREIEKIAEKVDKVPRIRQIKQKFGGLRFYVSDSTDEMESIITQFEIKSYHICEVCGEKGEVTNYGYIKTLCEKHQNRKS